MRLLVTFCLLLSGQWALGKAKTEITIFDGSERVILYRTSSHAGSKQLKELLNMVPGGEKFDVFKMPYPWKKDLEKMAKYPLHVRRMNNNFTPAFKIHGKDDEVGIEAGVSHLKEDIQKDLDNGIKAVFFHTGHYHENNNLEKVQLIQNTRYAYHAFKEQNEDPRVFAIDCLELTRKHFPATVRADGFHASGTANYIEGLEIVRAMCQYDKIPFPSTIEDYVQKKVKETKASAEILNVTYPSLEEPIHETLRMGDTVTIRWDTKKGKIPGVYIMLHAVFRNDYYISPKISVGAENLGKFQWTVSKDLMEAGNRPGRISPEKAKKVSIEKKRTHHQRFCFRIISSDLEQAQNVYNFSSRFTIDLGAPPREEPLHFDQKVLPQ